MTHDFETASVVDLKKAGAYVYAEDPTTEVLCLSFALDDGPIMRWIPGEPIPQAWIDATNNPKVIFVAHNAGFEKAVYRFIMVRVYGWPLIPSERYHDTMASAAQHGLPMAVEKLARVLRLGNQKWMEGSKITRAMSKPISRGKRKGMFDRDPTKLAIVYDYCDLDVEAQRDIHKTVGWQSKEERQVWLLDQEMNERGVRLDVDYIQAAQTIVDGASRPRLKEFTDLTGGLNVTQGKKILEWITAEGVSLPNLQKGTINDLLGLEDEHEDPDETLAGEIADGEGAIELPDHVRRALEIRQVLGSASIKKLRSMRACIANDGRVHGALQYYGAVSTGRWAGRLFQPQNFPRGMLKLGDKPMPVDMVVDGIQTGDWEYVAATLGDPIDVVVSGLRHSIIPGDGNGLVVGDYASIEARVVLALAGQYDKTALLASGADVYVDMAQTIYHRPVDKKRDPQLRQTGKNAVLGCGFQMGWKKFKLRYAPDMTDDEAKAVIDAYREDWAPLVPELWWGLEEAALETVRTGQPHEAYGILYQREAMWLTARMPSGGKLYYYDPQLIRKAMPWNPNDIREAWTYRAMKTGRWITVDAYGGLLTENVVQRIARDLLVDAMFKCRINNYPLVLTVHDELITDVPKLIADPEVLKQIMRDIPTWAREMKIPVDAEVFPVLERYRK